MYKLVEKLSKSKWKGDDGHKNEDCYVDTPYYSVVADGATCEKDIYVDDMKPGKIASSLVCSYFASLTEDVTFEHALEKLEQTFCSWYQKHPYFELRITTSFIVLNKIRNEIWVVGDCQALVDDKHYSYPKDVDLLMSSLRSYISHCLLEENNVSVEDMLENDRARKRIVPLLESQSIFQNSGLENTFCYGVLDGHPTLRKDCHLIKLDKSVSSVVLASDGYPVLKDSLEKTEKELQFILKEDPLMIGKYKNTKGLSSTKDSFDDRTYLRIENIN